MRNLKKFLALVLAMAMAFSLMLSASAAEIRPSTDFSDDDGITEAFVEAVDVLAGMKVYKGDENGFRPGSTITRAEVAALIYRLATGDVDDVRAGLYANYGNFTDVNEGDWFAGYVGYCANAGYIKGDNATTFRPYGQVTGYEALAMVLRAIGYDKNHEFEGATWQVNVSALGTQLGILDDIKTTDYANTLHLASRRDVVASILFNAAAYVPTVTYTPALNYSSLSNVLTGEENDTLGEKYFGLTYGRGIVVSNQGTGDTKTVWRTTAIAQGSTAVYWKQTDNKDDFTDVSLKWETGLKDFAHKYKVWYNRDDSGSKTVYTAYDEVVKTQLVAINANGETANGPLSGNNTNALGLEATKVGFVNTGTAFYSDSFKKFDADKQANAGVGTKVGNQFSKASTGGTDNADAADHELYLLISNSSGNSLDAVVCMNVESSKITQIDNVSATTSIKLPTSADDTYADSTDRFAPSGTDITLTNAIAVADDVSKKIEIKQSKLTANSTKTLGDYAVSIAIGVRKSGTASTITNYNVSKIVDTKVGQVVSYNTSEYTDTRMATINTNPDYVMLADGTKIEKSLLYYTVQDGTIPQQGDRTGDKVADSNAVAQDPDVYNNGTYRFYLDSEGKYIGAEPVREAEFIYGTYADYSQETSTSTFKYFMTGVTKDGEIVTRQFSTHNGGSMTAQAIATLGTNYHSFGIDSTPQSGIGRSRSYYGDVKDEDGATVKYNRYNGFMLTTSGGLYEDAATAAACTQMSPEVFGYKKLIDDTTRHLVTVNASDVRTGAKQAATDNGTALFLTENTKFIVVSGAGTDTVKATVYNGITEFLGDSTDVSFYVGQTAGNNDFDEIDTFYTVDDSWYANAEERYSHGIETIFLNANNVTRTGTNGLLYIGNNTEKLVDTYNSAYKLYTFYNGDQAVDRWINTGVANANAPDANTFYNNLQAAGTTSTGETVYVVGAPYTVRTDLTTSSSSLAVDMGGTYVPGTGYRTNSNYVGFQYVPTTRDARTAYITDSTNASNTRLFNVANANVVNLVPSILPGVSDVATLNEAASNMTQNGTGNVYVAIVVSGSGSNIASTIYVIDVTQPS